MDDFKAELRKAVEKDGIRFEDFMCQWKTSGERKAVEPFLVDGTKIYDFKEKQ